MIKNNDYKIEQFSDEDLDYFKNNLNLFDDFWNIDILEDDYKSEFSKYFVLKDNSDNILGFIGIKIIVDTIEIMNIVIKKDMRGNHLSNLLLDYIIEYGKTNNLSAINLEVNNQNFIAFNLYKKYNFNIVGTRKNYYENKYDAILMTKNLEETYEEGI